MKLKSTRILILAGCLLSIAVSASSTKETGRWTYGPWQTQDMVSLGNEILVVDFGQNGLWSYDGSWIRLSHLDPQRMVTWGDSNLVVDFGAHGLWKFDRTTWEKIAL